MSLAVALAGCAAAKATKPIYPPAEGAACTLVFDNQVSNSIWTFRAGIQMEVIVDGFSPSELRFLPMGQTTMQLPAGSHEMTIKADLMDQGAYYFNPTTVNFDVEPGKPYKITFKMIGSTMKSGYSIEYSGWPTEQTAGWPSEVYIANALFGGLPTTEGAG